MESSGFFLEPITQNRFFTQYPPFYFFCWYSWWICRRFYIEQANENHSATVQASTPYPLQIYSHQQLRMAGKRLFYEDEELITTTPGYNTEISKELKEKESVHGNIALVDGMGVRSTPYLEKHLNSFRLLAHDKLSIISAEFGTQKTALCNEINSLKAKVNGVVAEPVVPRIIDVLLPVLAVSVFVSKRSLPVRLVATGTVGFFTVKHNMPQTYGNLKKGFLDWEAEVFPEAVKQQNEIAATACSLTKDLQKYSSQAKSDLQVLVHEARKWVVDTLSDE